jgi:hypothetical protein
MWLNRVFILLSSITSEQLYFHYYRMEMEPTLRQKKKPTLQGLLILRFAHCQIAVAFGVKCEVFQ